MIFLLIFSYLHVSWNGDTLISTGNEFDLSDVKNALDLSALQAPAQGQLEKYQN